MFTIMVESLRTSNCTPGADEMGVLETGANVSVDMSIYLLLSSVGRVGGTGGAV